MTPPPTPRPPPPPPPPQMSMMLGEQLCLAATKWLRVVQQEQLDSMCRRGWPLRVSGALMKNSGSGDVCETFLERAARIV